jgi:hypothetical protein
MKLVTLIATTAIATLLFDPLRAFALDANQARACRWSGGNGETPAELAAVFEADAQPAPSHWYFYDFAPNTGVAIHFYETVAGELAASRIVTYGFEEPDWWSADCQALRVASRWEARE